MIKQDCAICGKNTQFEVLYKASFKTKQIDINRFSARRIPDRCHYRLVRCLGCGLIYSNPILEENKLKDLYTGSKLTYGTELENLKNTYGYYLDKILPLSPAKNNLLEIGCGNGFFLEEAKRLGVKNVWGVEPSVDAIIKADRKIKPFIKKDIFRKNLFKINFDVVCFFQTLDHIVNPNEFLKDCRKILEKNGLIFCIVHNSDSAAVKLLGEKAPIFDIEHTYLYNKVTLRKIFERNMFEVIEVFDIKNEYSISYWISLLPIGTFLKNIIKKTLRLFNCQNYCLKIKAGNIGLVARKI